MPARILNLLLSLLVLTPLAHAQLESAGPVSPVHGFPVYYRDFPGVALEPCLADPVLCAMGDLPNPGQPVVFPTNFPDELFYYFCDARMPTSGNGRAILRFAIEGSFANGTVQAGSQIVFARFRLRVDNLLANQTYRVTHPYGFQDLVPTHGGSGSIDTTIDIGLCPGEFTLALSGSVGPFLQWDPAVAPLAPAGFLGDGVAPHRIVGSPYATNFFRIEGPDVGGPGIGLIETQLFTIVGKLFQGPLPTPLQVERATYRRSALGAEVAVFAQSVGGASLEATGVGLPTTVLAGDPASGRFFAHFFAATPAALPPVVTVYDPANPTLTTQNKSLVDEVVLSEATYDPASHLLRVHASSGDQLVPPTLTALGLGTLDALGDLVVAVGTIPPAEISVVSSAGGFDTTRVRVAWGSVFPPGPPLANAGADQLCAVNQPVALDGTASQGQITSVLWVQTAGPNVVLSGATTTNPSFTFPAAPAVLRFRLTVSGPGGSTQDSVNIVGTSTGSETLTVSLAEYRPASQRWRIRGNSTVPGPGNVIQAFVGPTLGGQLIGSAAVDTAGAWAIDISGSSVLPDATLTISVLSTGGAQLLGVPVTLH